MFERYTRWICYSAQGEGGAPPSSGGSQGGGGGAPPGPPAPAPASGSDDPPAWARALFARMDAVEGGKAKAEADAARAQTEKAGLEQKAKTVEEQLAQFKQERVNDKIDLALRDAMSGHQFTDPKAGTQAIKVFRSDFRLDWKDGAALAIGPDGKAQHLADAFGAFVKGDGARFIAAAIQPGAGAPQGAKPSSTGPVSIRDMPEEDYRKLLAEGIRGPLTPGGPEIVIKQVPNRFEKLRNERIAFAMRQAHGNGQQKH